MLKLVKRIITKKGVNPWIFIGKRLNDLREKFDYSQKQVAEAIGISNVQLSRYESGIETLSQLRLLLIFMV
ncbi:helix-turn-helix transcriptional regulator [Parageobacillus sp. KH3-4]|uniref:helix-turn-helix domain-containing protein n=1 Tax=Parageobacillus sp. KH3-4 TaxID=2916802 RepID=UPI001FCC5E8C|nr:helix-turn-helix transcriptional regulator [Parageobacillus sp. KH3-4]BDG48682.1 hypothetical protein PspKH34_32430 [Parageobacillus sp. KH3-4]